MSEEGVSAMKYLGFALTCLVLFVVTACGGREMVADCSYEGPGSTYCHWDASDLKPGQQTEVCCPADHPYCGGVGLTCPAGYCCDTKPVPGPVTGGPASG